MTSKMQISKAIQFFDAIQLEFKQFYHLLGEDIQEQIQHNVSIVHYEQEFTHKNRRIVLLLYLDYTLIENEMHVFLIIQDITAQKKKQEEIQFLAYHDTLTHLPNRRFFYEKLDETLELAKQHHHTIALFLIDLNQFKLLNDTQGHLAGDEVLQIVAQILQETTENHGMAARLGGDEFVLYINQSLANVDSEKTIQQIQQHFSKSIEKYRHTPLRLNIGVSHFPNDGKDGQALINIADANMYKMKDKNSEVAK